MKKRLLILISLVVMILVAGCSSKESEEIIDVNNDFKENVDDPIGDVMDKLEEKSFALDRGEISEDELNSYIEDELKPEIDDLKSYVDEYEAPSTEDAKRLFDEMVAYSNLNFEGVDKSVQMIKDLLDDVVSETDLIEINEELEEIGVAINEKISKIEEMQEEFEEEYNIEFDEDLAEE